MENSKCILFYFNRKIDSYILRKKLTLYPKSCCTWEITLGTHGSMGCVHHQTRQSFSWAESCCITKEHIKIIFIFSLAPIPVSTYNVGEHSSCTSSSFDSKDQSVHIVLACSMNFVIGVKDGVFHWCWCHYSWWEVCITQLTECEYRGWLHYWTSERPQTYLLI